MLHVLWSLLNLGLLLCFLYVSYKATRLLRQQFGLPASLIFLVGLICFTIHPPIESLTNPSPQASPKVWDFTSKEERISDLTYLKEINLASEGWGMATHGISILLGENSQHLAVPIRANHWSKGFFYGIRWTPLYLNITPTKAHQFTYTVRATVDWQLLGLTLYSEKKEYQGILAASAFKQ